MSQEGVGGQWYAGAGSCQLMLAHTSLRKPTVCISSQFQVQCCQITSLNLAVVGVFTPWKRTEAFSSNPKSQLLNLIIRTALVRGGGHQLGSLEHILRR